MREMRRIDRKLTEIEGRALLSQAEHGTLCTVDADGMPYGTPMNFVYADGVIYFHCALRGHKLDNLAGNPRACFTAVDSVELQPEEFATKYRSVVAFGRVQTVEDDAERRHAMTLLLEKYSAAFVPAGEAYVQKALPVLTVLRMDIDELSCKGKL